VEGLNNKAKVTMRKSYGLRAYRVLELALFHSVAKLPEPESIHDFFSRGISGLKFEPKKGFWYHPPQKGVWGCAS
jgi:hypothetical protein